MKIQLIRNETGCSSMLVVISLPLCGQFDVTPPALTGVTLSPSSITFPRYSEGGTWRISYLFLNDAVSNSSYLTAADLQAPGFPSSIDVVRASQTVDGVIGNPAAGGTVFDNIFGGRAEVIVPPGVLSLPTDVTIDVLQSPLSVPLPQGFQGVATRFVDVDFSPPQPVPLPAPGLTMVLPTDMYTNPGTVLSLYRVDPVTGGLMPSPSVNQGQFVTGTVNAIKLTNVLQLDSTLAGIGSTTASGTATITGVPEPSTVLLTAGG